MLGQISCERVAALDTVNSSHTLSVQQEIVTEQPVVSYFLDLSEKVCHKISEITRCELVFSWCSVTELTEHQLNTS